MAEFNDLELEMFMITGAGHGIFTSTLADHEKSWQIARGLRERRLIRCSPVEELHSLKDPAAETSRRFYTELSKEGEAVYNQLIK